MVACARHATSITNLPPGAPAVPPAAPPVAWVGSRMGAINGRGVEGSRNHTSGGGGGRTTTATGTSLIAWAGRGWGSQGFIPPSALLDGSVFDKQTCCYPRNFFVGGIAFPRGG